MAVATCSASRGRNTQTRCHSVFEAHSSCAFFHERCVATERTVNFAPLFRVCRWSGSAPTNPTRVTELRYDIFDSPFFAPFPWGTRKARASAPKASGCFMGGTHDVWRGTGKAEDAKLPGAGISPKQCPREMRGRKM